MSVRCHKYGEKDKETWEALVEVATGGTFLHGRRFLSYHKDRFEDHSLCFEKGNRIIAVLPAAIQPDNDKIIVSHPGATYGGVVFRGRLPVEEMAEVFSLLAAYYASEGFSELHYKTVPVHIQQVPMQYDIYWLVSQGATIYRRDLWNTVPLQGDRKLTERRRRGIAKAQRSGVIVTANQGVASYEEFYDLLRTCLWDRHHVCPVHELEEMQLLQTMFPEKIRLWTTHGKGGILTAGAWVFHVSETVWHTQYIASSPEGRKDGSVDFLLESIILQAEKSGGKYVSFGASTEQQGTVLNEGLFDFKSSFGGGEVLQDFCRLMLSSRLR